MNSADLYREKRKAELEALHQREVEKRREKDPQDFPGYIVGYMNRERIKKWKNIGT